MTSSLLIELVLLLLHNASSSSIQNIPHHLLTFKIADLLPTNELLNLYQSDRLMSLLLGPLVMTRYSMCLFTNPLHYLVIVKLASFHHSYIGRVFLWKWFDDLQIPHHRVGTETFPQLFQSQRGRTRWHTITRLALKVRVEIPGIQCKLSTDRRGHHQVANWWSIICSAVIIGSWFMSISNVLFDHCSPIFAAFEESHQIRESKTCGRSAGRHSVVHQNGVDGTLQISPFDQTSLVWH